MPPLLFRILACALIALAPHVLADEDPSDKLLGALNRDDRPQIEALLADGASLNTAPESQVPVFLQAIDSAPAASIEFAIAQGGDANGVIAITGETALMRATRRGDPKVVAVLLAAKANVNARDGAGYTALMKAAESGRSDIAELLLKAGADIAVAEKHTGRTALRFAAAGGHDSVVRLLLAQTPPNPSWLPTQIQKALQDAADRGRMVIVEMLVKAGADVNAVDPQTGRAPLHTASQQGRLDTAQALLAAGADVDRMDRYGATPLLTAVTSGNAGLVKVLLDKGAKTMRRKGDDPRAISALTIAAMTGYGGLVELLIDKGADVDEVHCPCSNAITEAAAQGHTEVVRRLVQRGAKVDILRRGASPLIWALRGKHADTALLLLDSGANPRLKGADGKDAFAYGRGQSNPRLVQILAPPKPKAKPRTPSRARASKRRKKN